ncbi:MAG: aerobic carbon-monoxide dehydrogenase medium subunit [Solirubrobacteraceae bacterium]
MRPAPFQYVRVSGLDDALAALAEGGTALAGGQSLLPQLKRRLTRPELLVDLNAAPELSGVTVAGNHVSIGSMTRHQTIADSADLHGALSALPEAAGRIADPAVRARGTVGGSLCAADPRANLPAALLALGGVAVAAGPDGRREIALDDFFLDVGSSALARGELLVGIALDARGLRASGYDEVTVQPNGVPIVNAAVALRAGGLRVAVGGLARTPLVIPGLAAGASAGDIEAALEAALAGRARFEDMHGEAPFRAQIAAVVVGRTLRRVVSVNGGSGAVGT